MRLDCNKSDLPIVLCQSQGEATAKGEENSVSSTNITANHKIHLDSKFSKCRTNIHPMLPAWHLVFGFLLPLLATTLLPMAECSCRSQDTEPCESICITKNNSRNCVIRALVLLPLSDVYEASLGRVLPVLKVAEDEIRDAQLIPPYVRFEWIPQDDRCDASFALINAMDGILKNCSHVIFGPSCDYPLASVARITKYFHGQGTPLISVGGATYDFEKKKTSCSDEFFMLLRTGIVSFQSLAKLTTRVMQQYKWQTALFLHERNGQMNIAGLNTCYLMMQSLAYQFRSDNKTFSQYLLDAKSMKNLTVNLEREIGNQHSTDVRLRFRFGGKLVLKKSLHFKFLKKMTTVPNPDDIVQLLVSQIENQHEIPYSEQDQPDNVESPDKTNSKGLRRQFIPKDNAFYEEVIPLYTPSEFRFYFRMSRSCFALMIDNLGYKVKIYNMEKKFLFAIWMLSTRESFCAVGQRFGFAKGAVYQYFCEIIDGLCLMFKDYVHWPSETIFSHIEQGFKPRTGGYVPGIIGAIESCHILIKKPAHCSIYCNRNNTHSIVLQAVCDHQKIFTDVYVGAPGCLYTERVFRRSPLYKEIQNLIPEDYHIVGNSYYPPMKNLMIPFTDEGTLTDTQMLFNECLYKANTTVVQALRLLIARFRRLTYLDTSKPELANKMVCSCIILHIHILTTDVDDDEEEIVEEDVDLFLNYDDEDPSVSDEDTDGLQKKNYLLSLFEFI